MSERLDSSPSEYSWKCILSSILVFSVPRDISMTTSLVCHEGVRRTGETVYGGLDVQQGSLQRCVKTHLSNYRNSTMILNLENFMIIKFEKLSVFAKISLPFFPGCDISSLYS